MKRLTFAAVALLLLAADVAAALTLYAWAHGWRWASLGRAWRAELLTGAHGADLVALLLARSLANGALRHVSHTQACLTRAAGASVGAVRVPEHARGAS